MDYRRSYMQLVVKWLRQWKDAAGRPVRAVEAQA